MTGSPYLKTGRLADVLALIQILALDEFAHRSLAALDEELQRKPSSKDSWAIVATEHPEFFRMAKDDKYGVSLVARHALPKNQANEKTERLEPSFVGVLLQTAITLHDRQVEAAGWWKPLIPLGAVILAGILGGLSSLLLTCLKICQK